METFLRKYQALSSGKALPELRQLIDSSREMLRDVSGDGARFREAFLSLPTAEPSVVDLSNDAIVIGSSEDISREAQQKLDAILRELVPWRKGPFSIFGIDIDSEWRSYMKWDRIFPYLKPLRGKRILDIGCSNGYYLFRAMEHNPEIALGIDPYLCFYYQYLVMQRYARIQNLHYIPIGIEKIPPIETFFDTVFLMGILYHQPSPVEALRRIRPLLRKGGELVLETLIIPGEEHTALFPKKRYQKMRNVYFLPTVPTLMHFMERAGFKNVQAVDISSTTSAEQRKTEWVFSESLSDFLDPDDPSMTVEGYPAPMRATVVGEVHS